VTHNVALRLDPQSDRGVQAPYACEGPVLRDRPPGHVNFGHYLFYFDIGLTEYVENVGYDYSSLVKDGTDMLFVESHCNYKSPAKWPEVLDVGTRVAELGRRSIRIEFDITSQTDDRPC